MSETTVGIGSFCVCGMLGPYGQDSEELGDINRSRVLYMDAQLS